MTGLQAIQEDWLVNDESPYLLPGLADVMFREESLMACREPLREVTIMRVPISLPCVVPVRPSDGMAVIDGEPLPIEERPEKCCRDVFWTFGLAPTCDMHLRQLLTAIDDSYDAFVLDYRKSYPEWPGASDTELEPWLTGYRYAQDEARMLGDRS